MYRHALPPGFVLKSEKKAAEEAAKKEQISLEEFLEVEVGYEWCIEDDCVVADPGLFSLLVPCIPTRTVCATIARLALAFMML